VLLHAPLGHYAPDESRNHRSRERSRSQSLRTGGLDESDGVPSCVAEGMVVLPSRGGRGSSLVKARSDRDGTISVAVFVNAGINDKGVGMLQLQRNGHATTLHED
jgi:hypothetical protein